jgi:hypothetical protein
VQVTALTHEFAHASGEHEAPCGLHDAAEHLAMAPAPDVALGVPIPLVTAAAARGFDPLPPVSVRGSAARAPPPLR